MVTQVAPSAGPGAPAQSITSNNQRICAAPSAGSAVCVADRGEQDSIRRREVSISRHPARHGPSVADVGKPVDRLANDVFDIGLTHVRLGVRPCRRCELIATATEPLDRNRRFDSEHDLHELGLALLSQSVEAFDELDPADVLRHDDVVTRREMSAGQHEREFSRH